MYSILFDLLGWFLLVAFFGALALLGLTVGGPIFLAFRPRVSRLPAWDDFADLDCVDADYTIGGDS